jgi:hypothetical protein
VRAEEVGERLHAELAADHQERRLRVVRCTRYRQYRMRREWNSASRAMNSCRRFASFSIRAVIASPDAT